jgi:N-acetylglutamate synthase-like GNAT family acetyltransferase
MGNIFSISLAKENDIDSIHRLLVADNIMLSQNQIKGELDSLFLLKHNEKKIAVLNGNFGKEKEEIFWVAVHPFYPQRVLIDSMIKGLTGVICRRENVVSSTGLFR